MYRFLPPIWIEKGVEATICWSPVDQFGVCLLATTTSERSIVQYSMLEDTYSSESVCLFRFIGVIRICMVNKSHPMWDALVQGTHLKSHSDLLHVLNLCICRIGSKWMNHLMLKPLFELPIALL